MGAAAASGGASLVSVGGSALYATGNSEKLTKTYASAGNRRTWTFSTWVYRGTLGTTQGILSADVGAGNWAEIRIHFGGGTEFGSLAYILFTAFNFRYNKAKQV